MAKAGVWWSCAAEVDFLCVCVCNIHIKIKHWKVKGRFALSTEKDGLLLCQWTFSLHM